MAEREKSGGRQKGTPNKSTAAVKSALSDAFDNLGGVAALVQWGRDEPTEFYKLWVKMLPQEVKAEHTGADGAPLGISIEFIKADKV